MNKPFLYIILSVFLITACGTKKELTESQPTISKADHPYIQSFHEGLRFKTKGRIEEAIAKFEFCLTVRTDDDAVYYALSKLELQRDNPDKSAEYILKAAEIDPVNTWYIQELAYMYFEREDYPNSVTNFKKLVEIEPKSIDWLYGYAEALVRNDQEKDAIEILNQAEDQAGKHPQFSLQRFQLYMDMEDMESAEDELKQARISFPTDVNIIANLVDFYFKTNREEKGIAMLKELVIADPENGKAHLALADFYQQKGDMPKAYVELRAAFSSTKLDVDTKAKLMIRVHEVEFNIDPEMYELLDILIEVHPEEAIVYSIQGDYRLTAKDETGALEAYKKALSFNKDKYPIWNQVMIMEYQAGQYEELYAHSTECLELFPTMTTVYLLNGLSANQIKKYDEAIETLSYGIEVVLNDKELQAEFRGQIGEAYFGKKKYSAGIDNYKQAIALDPQSTLIKNNFAIQLADSKQELDLAQSLSTQVTVDSPNNAIYQDTYGWVLFQKGEFKKANEKFELALESDSEDAMINEHMGDVLFKLGKVEDALKYWEIAKTLGSTNSVLKSKITEKKYYDPID
ncbi:MAG: tetratricopeptide repeat protein [Crocinitomicaceae bacterium]|nr:tetratricopeptide repeat protein [Crocinitomicaceae bacterium]